MAKKPACDSAVASGGVWSCSLSSTFQVTDALWQTMTSLGRRHVQLNRHFVTAGMIIAGILAMVSIVPMVFPSQSQPVTATTESQQSYFYTTVTTVDGVTLTEVLVNTAVQIRPTNSSQQSSTLDFASIGQFMFLLGAIAVVIGFWSSHKTQYD